MNKAKEMQTYYFIEADDVYSVLEEGKSFEASSVQAAIEYAEKESAFFDTALIIEDAEGNDVALRQQPSKKWIIHA